MNPVCENFSATSDAKYCSVAIGSAILKSWGSVLHQVKLYEIYTAQKRQHCEKWSFPGKSRFSRRFWQCRFFSSNCTCDAVQHLSVSQFKCTHTCDAVQGLSVSQLRFFTPANLYLYRLSVCRSLSVCVCVCVCVCVILFLRLLSCVCISVSLSLSVHLRVCLCDLRTARSG